MGRNYLKNSTWLEERNGFPMYFEHVGPMHYDHCLIESARAYSLSFSQPDQGVLRYHPMIKVENARQLTMGLFIRGNDIECINYVVTFYDQNQGLLQRHQHNVAHEVGTEFKKICVTYQIPPHVAGVKISWEFKGIVTGVTMFRPSLSLN